MEGDSCQMVQLVVQTSNNSFYWSALWAHKRGLSVMHRHPHSHRHSLHHYQCSARADTARYLTMQISLLFYISAPGDREPGTVRGNAELSPLKARSSNAVSSSGETKGLPGSQLANGVYPNDGACAATTALEICNTCTPP